MRSPGPPRIETAVVVFAAVAISATHALALSSTLRRSPSTTTPTAVYSAQPQRRRACRLSSLRPPPLYDSAPTSPLQLYASRQPDGGADATVAATAAGKDEDDEGLATVKVGDKVFWAKQRALAAQMTAKSDAELRKEQLEKFAKRRLALVSDTVFFSILIASFLWAVSPTPLTAASFALGAVLGTAYSYGLGKYVETIGGSVDDEGAIEGAGVGQARFAFLILLFVLLGKFRGQIGLQEIPAVAGFFVYQLASLSQGLKEYED